MGEAQVFINYRRDDSRGWASRLHADLSRRFGDGRVFRDIEMPGGIDFVERLNDAVEGCDVVLALIGPRWLDARGADGGRRLDDPGDFVRLELAQALARPGVDIIPVLVDGARISAVAELPPPLAGLARRNAVELTDRHWDDDVDDLQTRLEELMSHDTEVCEAQQRGHKPAGDRQRRAANDGRRVSVCRPGPAPAAAITAALVSGVALAVADGIPHRLDHRHHDAAWVLRLVAHRTLVYALVGALAALACTFAVRRARPPATASALGLAAGAVAGVLFGATYAWMFIHVSHLTQYEGWPFGAGTAAAALALSVGFAGGRAAAVRAGFGAGLLAGAVDALLIRWMHHIGQPPSAWLLVAIGTSTVAGIAAYAGPHEARLRPAPEPEPAAVAVRGVA